jgi:uncharacterized protein (DUF736 family)
MMIGKFRAKGDGYIGQLDALGLTVADMTFRPVLDKQGDGPDFIVIGYGEPPEPEDLTEMEPGKLYSNTYEVGAAWKKTSKKGNPYLSVKLDGPTLAAPINCALIGRKDGTFRLIWTRKDGEESAAEEQAAA